MPMLAAAAIPILIAKCLTCHNSEAKTSGLDLSTRETLLAGGSHGPVVVPGDPSISRLYQYVATKKMPPGNPLDPADVEALRFWIEQGASYGDQLKLTSATRPRAGLDWWSLQTPKQAPVPRSASTSNPIDAFLSEKLSAAGLDFAPRADHRTLIRRLHFTLTGLPPRRADLDQSYEQAIERLLASPRYGERWARHWLDIVRFGESDGGEHNNERMTAWKYRDYVIDALNADKPYTQFIREQIAGDLIGPANPMLVAATGFLVAGPWDSVTKKINRDELMRKTIRQDELDDFVTTTFSTFQALTVNCARCHDHKFDPIPQRDYYRLTAAFRGVTYGERDVYTPQQKKDRDERTAPRRQRLAALNSKLEALEAETRTRLLTEKFASAAGSRKARKLIPVNAVYNVNHFATVRGQSFRFVMTAQQGKGEPVIDRFALLAPDGTIAHELTAWKGAQAATDDIPAVLSIELPRPTTISGIRWSADGKTGRRDGAPRVYRFEASDGGTTWRTIASSLDHDVPAEFELPDVTDQELDGALPAAARESRQQLLAERRQLQRELDQLPPLETVHSALLEPQMVPTHLLDRGAVAKPLEELTPGALSSIRQLPDELAGGDDRSRRLALADWLTDPRNPLTARVIVNRVWFYHFGIGLVNTPSDFGFNGDRPSHPELLDWLAVEFVNRGWSLKWLHRQILSSGAFQQSSRFNEKAHSVDAGNRLLWRWAPRRLDAETLRDTILASSGSLTEQRSGPSFLLQKKAPKGSYLYLALDNDGPEVWRRAVYKFAARGGERVFMDSFDCPDPAVATPQRSVSNTPVQALTLLNNRFVLRQAELLADRIRKDAGAGLDDQIGIAYRLLFLRAPSSRERQLARPFIDKHGLALYCRTLMNINEFIYVP
jgi:hypothetical protein